MDTHKKTPQRTVIYDALRASNKPLSPQELLEITQKTLPNLGIATIHRTIKYLTEEGTLCRVEMAGEPLRFCTADKGHHHHFKCIECKDIFDLEGCSYHIDPQLPKGFTHSSHEITIFGYCDMCSG